MGGRGIRRFLLREMRGGWGGGWVITGGRGERGVEGYVGTKRSSSALGWNGVMELIISVTDLFVFSAQPI